MRYDVVILHDAEIDLADLYDDLSVQSPATIQKVRIELAQIKKQLAQFPFSYQANAIDKTRRVVMHSCRCNLYHRVISHMVEIIAVMPQMAGPDTLMARDVH